MGRLVWLDVSELLRFRCVDEPGILLAILRVGWLPDFEGSELSILLLWVPRFRGFGGSITHSVFRPFVWHRLQILALEGKRQRDFDRLHGTQALRFGSGSEIGIRIVKT